MKDPANISETNSIWYSLAIISIAFVFTAPALAERASLVIDLNSGKVLYEKNARLPSYPASLTKLMTAYLIYEAVVSDKISFDDQLQVSKAAARMPAVRLGLKQGHTITLEEAVLAMIVRSANDAAVAAAERIAGSEPAFAYLMNAKAKSLGMSDTVFYNATGLPHPGQVTSARDMAILAWSLLNDFPQYHSSFSARSFQYRGKTINSRNNYNNNISEIQGLKTGFTCRAGFNLVASFENNGHRLIGVILGERNLRQRDARMSKILKQAVASESSAKKHLTIGDLATTAIQGKEKGPNKKVIADVCISGSRAPEFSRASGWGLVLGVSNDEKEALALSRRIVRKKSKTLKTGRPLAIPFLRGLLLYRACITNLVQKSATAACRQLREQDQYCVIINPQVVQNYVAKGKIAMEKSLAVSDYTKSRKSTSLR